MKHASSVCQDAWSAARNGGCFVEARNEEEVRLRLRLAERDQVQLEIQNLAIRIQKNGGVEISDRKIAQYVVKACFVARDLVRWIARNHHTTEEMAMLICEEMWKQGLISHATHRFKPFTNATNEHFRVAHPYAIHLRVLPSDLELLSRQLHEISGPKLKDRLVFGSLVRQSFRSSELVDWCMSAHNVYPRERAIQISQQLLDEGYIYNVSGSTRFVDQRDVLCQHKDAYCGNLCLSGRVLEHLIERFNAEYSVLVKGSPGIDHLTVGQCVKILQSLVQDCHDIKARYILSRLRNMQRVEIVAGSGRRRSSIFASPVLETTMTLSAMPLLPAHHRLQQKDIDAICDDDSAIVRIKDLLKPIFTTKLARENPGSPRGVKGPNPRLQRSVTKQGNIYDRILLDNTSKIDLVGSIRKQETQQRALRLLAQLGGKTSQLSYSSITPFKRAMKMLSKLTHILMTLALTLQVISSTHTSLPLNTGIQNAFEARNFSDVCTIDSLHDWIEVHLFGTNFEWLGHHITLADYPQLLVSTPERVSCDRASERFFRARAASSHGLGVVEDIENETTCYIDTQSDEQGLTFDYAKRYTLYWQAQDYADSPMQAINQETFQNLTNVDATALLPVRLMLQLNLLSSFSSIPTITVVRAIAHMGPLENEVFIRTTSAQLMTHGLICAFTWASLLFCVIDFLALTWQRRSRYMKSTSAAIVMTRMVLCLVGLGLQLEHNSRVRSYLDDLWESRNDWSLRQTLGNNVSDHDTWVFLYNADNASQVCLTLSMFFTSVSLLSKLGGSRYNMFDVLMRTLGAVNKDLEVILLVFVTNFIAFSMATYAIMQSAAPEFQSPMRASMTLFGSMFGGAPWRSFHTASVPSLLTGTTGYLLFSIYLFVVLFIILSLFQALMLESFQAQKKQEDVLHNEIKLHMYTSETFHSLGAVQNYLLQKFDIAEHPDKPSSFKNNSYVSVASPTGGSRDGRVNRSNSVPYGSRKIAPFRDPLNSTLSNQDPAKP